MEGFIHTRSEERHMDVALHFETRPLYKIPMFFAVVSHSSRAMVSGLLTYITEPRIACVTAVESHLCPQCNPLAFDNIGRVRVGREKYGQTGVRTRDHPKSRRES
jgi:hypothetical protein